MKKINFLVICILASVSLLNAWEVNTHRAIDKTALNNLKKEEKNNLEIFVKNIKIENINYQSEKFEGYKNYTYFDYISDGEEGGISNWNQTFSKNFDYQDLIEAGTVLEDAVYHDAGLLLLGGDGRFNNHYYDPQNGGKELTWGYGPRTDAISWTIGYKKQLNPFDTRHYNAYSYTMAKEYFKYAFTEAEKSERRRLQAKMFVSIGHVMHMMNDMNVPAHVRDDPHPLWDSLSYGDVITSFFKYSCPALYSGQALGAFLPRWTCPHTSHIYSSLFSLSKNPSASSASLSARYSLSYSTIMI